jgi:signal transduction histidine kinase/ligand-binding sensor domain-containing protein
MALTFRQRTFAAETIVDPSRYSFAVASVYSSSSKKTGRGHWVSWTILVVLLLCTPMFAIDRDRRIDELYHTAWTTENGAPEDIRTLAQTSDGFLWIGTGKGLFRFDGERFEHYQPPSGPNFRGRGVRSLLATPDGGLWISFDWAVGFLKDGKITYYGPENGFSKGRTAQFVRDRRGVIWAVRADGLARFDGSRWKQIASDWNINGGCNSAYADSSGTLWASTEHGVVFLREGENRFREASDQHTVGLSMAQATDGEMWIAQTDQSVHTVPVPWQTAETRHSEIRVGSEAILIDNQGSLWITTLGDGIRRVPVPERLNGADISEFGTEIESFTHLQGLTNDYVTCILQDLEGNIWVGTNEGLDRFRQGAFAPVALPSGSVGLSLVARDKGDVWVATSNHDPLRVLDRKVNTEGLPKHSIYCFFQDRQATVWMCSIQKLFRFEHGRIGEQPDEIATPGKYPVSIAEDSSHGLWVNVADQGLMRLEEGKWRSLESLGGPKLVSSNASVASDGTLWYGSSNFTVVKIDGSHIHVFTKKDGIRAGDVKSIQCRGPDVWIAGARGIDYFDGNHFRPVIAADGTSFQLIEGMVATADSGLWFSEDRGIIHVPQNEIDQFKKDPKHRVIYQLFDVLDGLTASPQRGALLAPSVLEGTDGRIWFALIQGLVWIDPHRIPRNTVPPTVSIQSITAVGLVNRLLPSKFPAHTTTLQIAYTAPNLSIPERVHFRYKLDGQDKSWNDVGGRREAFYTNLGPGPYSFHVIACNDDGVWNETGTTWKFFIAPAWYQTLWFRMSLGLAAIGLAWMLYSLRLRQATAQIQARLGERVEERERIARELHDTLIQSVDGLMLRLQTALDEPDPGRSRQMIEKALDSADEVMLEGRQRVSALRAEATTVKELSEALASYGQDLSKEHPTAFSVALAGSPKAIDPFVRNEAYCIGREALGNAFQHADATKIEVEVTYDRRVVHMRVRDNGHGIDEQILNGGRPGHWGLRGMRERAQAIGGTLAIESRPGVGTEIDLEIPAELAFEGYRPHNSNWMKRLIGNRRVMR